MSKININNYEAFWLDYIDGNLCSDDVAEFVLFATQHPELGIDFEENLVSLTKRHSAALSDAEKNQLKELAELEELVVLELDGELANKDRLMTIREKQPKTYSSLIEHYSKTKLVGEHIEFSEKIDLKQPLVIPIYLRVAVAAAIVGITGIVFPWNSAVEENNEISDIEVISTTPVQLAGFNKLEVKFNNHSVLIEKSDFTNKIEYSDENSFVAQSTKDPVQDTIQDILPISDLVIVEPIIIDTLEKEDIDENPIEYNIALNIDTIDLELAADSNPSQIKNNKTVTVPVFLADKVLKVEKQDDEPLIASILDQKTNWDVDYKEEQTDDKKVTQFKLGKFEFYKSTGK